MTGWYILKGHTPVPCDDILKLASWGIEGNTRVAETSHDGVVVSTVFLKLDHNYGVGGPPLLFETLVFGGVFDSDMARYATWEEAEAGHVAMCEKVFPKGE